MAETARRCPCGHSLDPDGDPDQYGCLNGRIYGPCGDECCNGRCDDTAGFCQSADGCCDPENRDPETERNPFAIGTILTTADPQPPAGTTVRDDCGVTWFNDGYYPMCWVRPDLVKEGVHSPKSWNKIAGNYGPVTVLAVPRRRCESEACDEYDGIHCYGDGCAMARERD